MRANKFLFVLLLISPLGLMGQFTGEWNCAYATLDDQPNATGNRTISVAAYGEDDFVALVADFADNDYYMVAYKDADSVNGRLGYYQYSGTDQITAWINGFDQTFFNEAKDLATMRYDDKDIVLVANNDAARNIIAYELTADSFKTYPMRMSTGDAPIWGIDIDGSNRVYVTREGDSTNAGSVLVFDSPDNESAWSAGHSAAPLHEIVLPEAGSVRGVAVNEDGTLIYVSNYMSRKVYCYIGDPENGYDLYDGFSFIVNDSVTEDPDTYYGGPWGLKMMPGNNILFAACALDFVNSPYSYGRVYLLDPNDGTILDTIDCAQWNFDQTGAYNNNGPGNVSGYAAPMAVDFDQNSNVYIQSYYGWTVDKWEYSETLPTIEITILTSVEKISNLMPDNFELDQNYPNPFNPSTTLRFSIPESAEISLSIYTISGELVSNLIDGVEYSAGVYELNFDGSGLSSGTYIYSLSDGQSLITKKMILLK